MTRALIKLSPPLPTTEATNFGHGTLGHQEQKDRETGRNGHHARFSSHSWTRRAKGERENLFRQALGAGRRSVTRVWGYQPLARTLGRLNAREVFVS